MPSDSPLLAPIPSRRRRRLVLYIFGSTVLILILHAAFATAPTSASLSASQGLDGHYDRYTSSVAAWRAKGKAAVHGAMDGWRQAGNTGYDEDEAQEYVEVGRLMPVGGDGEAEAMEGDPMVESAQPGQEQQQGQGPVVEEVSDAGTLKVPEASYDWPAAWPVQEHEPTREQVQEEEQLHEQSEQEQGHEGEQEQHEQGEQSGEGEHQQEGEQHDDGEHRDEGEQREGEQQGQEGQQEEGQQQADGISWKEIKNEGEQQAQAEQPLDAQPDHNDVPTEAHSHEGDHEAGEGEVHQEVPQDEGNDQHQEEQTDFAAPPGVDFQPDQPSGESPENPEDNKAPEASFFESMTPPPAPPSESNINPDDPPKEPPSTERYDYTINLPANLPAHDASNQPRVVILQHVFPTDTVSRKLFSLSEAAYRTYAEYWGYKYVKDGGVYMPNEFDARRKGMNKLYPVLRVMIDELGKDDGAEWILVTDADTVPINPSIPVHTLIPPSPHVWFMGNEDWNGFNAGNMLLRISRETVAFMSHVIAREVDMSRFENTGKYISAPPSDQEALCLSFAEEEWRDHFYRIPMKWFNAYSSPYEPTQEQGGPVNLPWTDGGEQQAGVWTPQLNFHLVFILKHYREAEDLQRQMEKVWNRMAEQDGWKGEVEWKSRFAAEMWWGQFKDGDRWRMGIPPKCSGF